MKKTLTAVLAAALAFTFVACGSDEKPDNPTDNPTTTTTDQQPPTNTASGSLGEAYQAWLEAKRPMVGAINDALGSQPETAMESLALLPAVLIDLSFVAVTMLTDDITTAQLELWFTGSDVTFNRSGDDYKLEWDDNADASGGTLNCSYRGADEVSICVVTTQDETGADEGTTTMEFVRTSYGYAGQFTVVNATETMVVQITTDGQDGVLGMTTGTSGPSTGSINSGTAMDVPKQLAVWYQVTGNHFAGQLSSGGSTEFDFTREP